MFVKGIIATYPVGMPWYFDLQKTCALVTAKCCNNFVIGEETTEAETQLFSQPILKSGLEEQHVSESSMQSGRVTNVD